MKKVLSIILTLTIILAMIPLSSLNVTAEETQYTEGYFTYTVTNGEATIADFDDSISGDITIPSKLGGYPVTSIGTSAFSGCTSLTSVTIINSITSIGESAFYGCSSLRSVNITDMAAWCNIDFGNVSANPLYYGANLYLHGELVTDLVIPDSVTRIKDYAFYGCTSLTSVIIPDSVTSIGYEAFCECYALESAEIGDGVTDIEYCAFAYCEALENLTLGNGVTTIGEGAFGCCSFKSIVIPDSVVNLGPRAFGGNDALESVVIPDNINVIVEGLFFHCYSLKYVNIPKGVTKIEDTAFYCTAIENIDIPDGVTSIGEFAFTGCKLNSVILPNSLTLIDECAFSNCTALTNITMPNSVTSIGESAFGNCSSITKVFYRGSSADKSKITIDSSNTPLTNATWYYDSCIGTAEHTYDNACDTNCNVCELEREVPDHIYDNNCDNKCNVCDFEREVPDHIYDNNCDNICNECGSKRPETSAKIGVSNIRQTSKNDVNGQPVDVIAVDVNISQNNSDFSAGRFRIESDQGLAPFISKAGNKEVAGYDKGDEKFNYNAGVHSNYFQVVFDSKYNYGIDTESFSLGTYYFVLPEDCGIYTFSVIWMDGCNDNSLEYEMTTYPSSIDYTVHFYDNTCDSECNKCEFKREVPDHIYDNNCDNKCNVCDFEREVPDHSYTLNDNHTCDICKYSKGPIAPDLESKTYYSVTLIAMDGFEYSMDGQTWQDSNLFTNLLPETTYTFYQRVKASEVALVSEISPVLTTKTEEEPVYTIVFKNWDGSVISTNTYHYGDKVIVPANPSRIADNTYTYTFAGWDNEIINCEGNATYTATYTPVYIDYTVEFKNWDGSVLSTKTYHYGDKVEAPANPTRGTDKTYTYTFAGWDKEVVNCMGNETYTATYTPTYVDYIVIFKDWDESVLSIKSYHYGDNIIAPTNYNKPADNTYTYEFAGWDSKADKCTGNAIYNATYTPVYIDYTVEFKNWDGSVISTNTYHYGDKVIVPANPSRIADNTYTYTFAGWDNEIINCEGNATYTATYTATHIDYIVTFKNWDGTILSTETYHYGDKIVIPETPTKEADNIYTYTFAGWDNEVVNCEGNATYTATYTPVYIDYTVVFKNWDDTVISSETYHYGDKVTVPSDPTRAADKTYAYTFVGWDKEVIDCNGNVVYTAVYDIAYLLGDLNGDGSVNTSDLATMKLFLAGINDLSDIGLLAGDLNVDGDVNTTDLAQLKLKLAGIE